MFKDFTLAELFQIKDALTDRAREIHAHRGRYAVTERVDTEAALKKIKERIYALC